MRLFSSIVLMSMILVTAAQPVLVLLMKVKQKTVGSRGQKQCLENINHWLTVKNTKHSIFNNLWNNIIIMRSLAVALYLQAHQSTPMISRQHVK